MWTTATVQHHLGNPVDKWLIPRCRKDVILQIYCGELWQVRHMGGCVLSGKPGSRNYQIYQRVTGTHVTPPSDTVNGWRSSPGNSDCHLTNWYVHEDWKAESFQLALDFRSFRVPIVHAAYSTVICLSLILAAEHYLHQPCLNPRMHFHLWNLIQLTVFKTLPYISLILFEQLLPSSGLSFFSYMYQILCAFHSAHFWNLMEHCGSLQKPLYLFCNPHVNIYITYITNIYIHIYLCLQW